MRFRKRITIMKGLRLNVSKSGISMTGGIPGLSVNVGRQGSFLNTGIPGTGIYDRKRIGRKSNHGGTRDRDSARGTTSGGSATGAPGHDGESGDRRFFVELDDRGKPVLTDSNGNPVKDKSLLRSVRRTDAYKEKVLELSRRVHKSHEDETAELVEIHRLTPELEAKSGWQEELDSLRPEPYKPRRFSKARPDEGHVRAELESEARREVRTLAFWRRRALRREYVEERLADRMREAEEEWKRERREFQEAESQRRAKWEREAQAAFETRKRELERAIAGDKQFVENSIERRIGEMELPIAFSIDVDFDPAGGVLHLDIDLPEIEDLPVKKTNILKSGRVSIKDKSKRELYEQYAYCITGMLFFFSGEGFNVSPAIREVVASGYTQRLNGRTGHDEDQYVASVRFGRESFAKLNTDRIEPTEAIAGFEHRFAPKKTGELKTVEPL